MTALSAILLVLLAAACVIALHKHFSVHRAVEVETLEFRIAIEFASGLPTFEEAGAFILRWAADFHQCQRDYPAFRDFRGRRFVEEAQREAVH